MTTTRPTRASSILVTTPSAAGSPASTSSPRARRINVRLPQPSATNAAFISPSGVSTLTEESVAKERARYEMLVSKNATSEAILKMPNIATKPASIDDLEADPAAQEGVCRLPRTSAPIISNVKVVMDNQPSSGFFAAGYRMQNCRVQADK
ncbi:hypothetical protein BGZ83_001531 [Gryganskiella cystojenkinii]|nr:hypothetical protein BGZ83_001531 [Gryganskiella cystojenkinii]